MASLSSLHPMETPPRTADEVLSLHHGLVSREGSQTSGPAPSSFWRKTRPGEGTGWPIAHGTWDQTSFPESEHRPTPLGDFLLLWGTGVLDAEGGTLGRACACLSLNVRLSFHSGAEAHPGSAHRRHSRSATGPLPSERVREGPMEVPAMRGSVKPHGLSAIFRK